MTTGWLSGLQRRLPQGVRPYLEAAPLAALFLGISSGFAFAMIGATLTTRLAQHGVTKNAVTAFTLTILAYNFKFLWAPLVDNVRLPVIGRFGQRRSWLWLAGVLVMAAVASLGFTDPDQSLFTVAIAALAVGAAGATFDIIIDAYPIGLLDPHRPGVGSGFVALLIGVFVGGILYERLGMKRSVLISLILMAVSNLSFAGLAAVGHSNIGMAAAVSFENFASGIGGVTVVAYLSALCNLRFTASQYALLSALASIAGRFLTGTTTGALIDAMGYVNFYLLTTVAALPGVIPFWFMIRSGLADLSIGSAGKDASGSAAQ